MNGTGRVEIEHVASPQGCAELARVLADVWGFAETSAVASQDTLRAMAYSGCYVAAVRVDGRLVGGGFGWPTRVDGEWRLHSHVIGFLDGYRALGLGFRIKHHQRDFAREQGLAAVEWTYDPLSAPNARFNLAKLGARVQSFHRDFYGELQDVFSAGLGSDRFVVRWGLDDAPPLIEEEATPAMILDVAADGTPIVGASDAATLVARIPTNIVQLRAVDKALAIQWRDAFAETVGAAVQAGATVAAMTAGCAYVLEAGPR
jgi:predicted GNAT superfamily acetyltransferase